MYGTGTRVAECSVSESLTVLSIGTVPYRIGPITIYVHTYLRSNGIIMIPRTGNSTSYRYHQTKSFS